VANFVTPDKTASRPFSAGGVYFGTVTRVEDSLKRVYVKIPRFVTNAEFGPLAVVGPELPVVGDRVACLFMENRTDDIVVIGVIKNQSMLPTSFVTVATSTTRPASPKVGTIVYESDTEDAFVWNGTSWVGFGGVGPTGPTGPTGSGRLTVNAQTGTTYTLVLSDEQKLIEASNASAIALTVPPNSSVAFAVGSQIHVIQTGVGQVTLTAGAGVTVNGSPGLKLRAQWSAVTLIKRATDTWVAIGDLSA